MNRRKELLGALLNRLDRSIQRQSGISFSANELDILIVAGLHDVIYAALGSEERARAEARLKTVARAPSAPPPVNHEPDRPPPPFKPEKLAEYWGVSKNQVYKHLRSGALKHFRIGEMYRITPEAVAEFEREHGMGRT